MPAHRITLEGSDVSFECPEGQTLLDAALKAGIGLPYSCRKGVCGSCAGGIARGEVLPTEQGGTLTSDACAPGQVLYCRCTPASDVVLRPLSWQRVDPAARKRFTAKVFRNEAAAPDVSLLHLRLPAGQRAKFRAGQYLQLTLDDGSLRSYSMANAPHESDGVLLHVRHVPGGRFSGQVGGLAAGDLLRIELPFGTAFPPDDAGTAPLLFVAGGTGFAPVKSVIDHLMKTGSTRPITLIWGARDPSGIYLPNVVERWRAQRPGFRFIAALESGAQALPGAFAGRADEAVLAHGPQLADHLLYCCGSPAMVEAVRKAAVGSCGLDPAAFHADAFAAGPVVALGSGV